MTKLPEKIGTLEFNMILVRGTGDQSFRMGSKKDEKDAFDDEKPDHEVRVSDFYLGEYPVTQDLWLEVMGENPAYFQGLRRPVERVSWYDALVFCNRLSLRTGRKAAYRNPDGSIYGQNADKNWELPNEGDPYFDKNADGYRLPTEAEWEYAARGGPYGTLPRGEGRGGVIFSGSDKLKEVGWYAANSHGETKPVGLKLPNALGLYDMSGNVWEWCEDWYDAGFYTKCAKKGLVVDPCNREKGSYRVYRGGGWFYTARYCRSAYRGHWYPGGRSSYVGFRLCLAPQSVG